MAEADHIFLQRWRTQRDAQAFQELVRRYSAMVYATCRRILGNAADAEDVAQECFEALAQTPSVPETYLGAWLHCVAVRMALNQRRGEMRRRRREETYAAAQPVLTRPEWDDIYHYVDEAIVALPEHLRNPVVAHFLDGRTQAEVAETLGVSRQTAANRITAGIAEVRQALRRRGIEVAGSALGAMLAINAAEAAPPALLATLGKIGVAGVGTAGTSTPPLLTALGGTILMKKTILIVATLLAVIPAAFWLTQMKENRVREVGSEPVEVVSEPVYVLLEAPPVAEVEVMVSDAPDAAPHSEMTEAPAAAVAGSVSGRVYESDSGRPILGAQVYALEAAHEDLYRATQAENRSPHELLQTAIGRPADADGNFRFDGLEAGNYLLFADIGVLPHERKRATFRKVNVRAGQVATGADLAIDMGVRIGGIVLDQQGKAVENAMVSGWEVLTFGKSGFLLETLSAPSSMLKLSSRDLTGKDGRFLLAGFQAGDTVIVTANREDIGRAYSDILKLARNAEIDLTLVLVPGITISGRVITPDRRPVQGVGVNLRQFRLGTFPEGLARMESWQRGESVADGSFSITQVPPGEYGLMVQPPGGSQFVDAVASVDRVRVEGGKDIYNIEVVFDLKLTISGRVTDTQGRPLANVGVSCASGGQLRFARTNEAGEYLIYDLNEGLTRLRIQDIDHKSIDSRTVPGAIIEDVPAGSTGVDFQIDPWESVTVAGRVLDEATGEALPEFQLQVVEGAQRPGQYVDRFQGYYDPEGRFEVGNLAPGPLTIEVRAAGYAQATESLGDVPSGAKEDGIEIRLQRGITVRGVVYDTQQQPVPEALIFAGPLPHIERAAITRSGADGRFEAQNLPPDTTSISALAEGYAGAEAPLLPLQQRADYDVILVLTRGGTVEGYVYFEGQPLAGQQVVLALPQPGAQQEAVTDTDGGYRFTGVEAGTTSVGARVNLEGEEQGGGQRFLTRTAEVAEGYTTQVDFHFTDAQTLEGFVTRDGVAQGNIRITLSMESPEGTLGYHSFTDGDGYYRFDGISQGTASISAVQGTTHIVRTVEIPAGQASPVRVDLELLSGTTVTGHVRGLEQAAGAGVMIFEGDLDLQADTLEEFTNLLAAHMSDVRGSSQVHPDGHFELSGVAPGRYTVLVVEPADAAANTFRHGVGMVEVGEDYAEPVEITLR